jgi:3-phytase
MPSYGDAADDPAIWVHPEDPSESLVIGTDKQSGLFVFDLHGRALQHLADGRMNNVDLRDGFPLGGETVTLVTASNRSDDSIAAYRVDAASRTLVAVADGVLSTGFDDPYGLCMYRSARSGEFYVFVNEGGVGTVRQWRLFDNGSGRVAAEQVREFEVGSQAEGCVADDRFGHLYVAEDDRGLWKYPAEPDGGEARTQVDGTGEDGRLTDDVEGVALWQGPEGDGYIVVSNQGADNYALSRREGDNALVGFVHVVANAAAGIDGASETDGLDVSSAPLGTAFPQGLLVVQDGRNIAPEERQNFKYVSWADVVGALEPE